jgi:hypothetical protein
MTTYEARVPLVGDVGDEALDKIREVAGIELVISFESDDQYGLAETVGNLNRELESMGVSLEIPRPRAKRVVRGRGAASAEEEPE